MVLRLPEFYNQLNVFLSPIPLTLCTGKINVLKVQTQDEIKLGGMIIVALKLEIRRQVSAKHSMNLEEGNLEWARSQRSRDLRWASEELPARGDRLSLSCRQMARATGRAECGPTATCVGG